MTDLTYPLKDTLETILRVSREPFNSAQLFEMPEIRVLARSKNRVSDCLAILWREGKVVRRPALVRATIAEPAKWSYQWKTTPSTVSVGAIYIYGMDSRMHAARANDKPNVGSQVPAPIVDTQKYPSWCKYLATLKAHH